jgi:drug/metabolite transporter (DMT)-like permease
MELWIPITIAAAFVQNLRSSLQKHLRAHMGVTGATFARFGFGLPFALVFLTATLLVTGESAPSPGAAFLGWALTGAAAQIAATALLIRLFSLRNFAAGTAYSRTEPVFAALFALALLGENLGAGALVAILICTAGVTALSLARISPGSLTIGGWLFALPARLGLAAGASFGLAALAYRAASLSLPSGSFAVRAAITLAVTLSVQTLAMLAWMAWRERGELAALLRAWKPAALAGLAGATASFGWFMAMTLESAAVVKTLAQVEMLFAFASSVYVFGERVNRMEIAGCLLIVTGIVVLLALGG